MAWLALPLALGVVEKALEAAPLRLRIAPESSDRRAEERDNGCGPGEAELCVGGLTLARTHLHLRNDERRTERGRRPAAALERPLDLRHQPPERHLPRARDPGLAVHLAHDREQRERLDP